MRLTTLKPRLQVLDARRAKLLTVESINPRPRGERWMETRRRIQVRDRSLCAGCGTLWQPHRDQVDHKVPREQGGSDEDENLQLLCCECHKAKTAQEAGGRARG